jgi:hypothetical protein
MAFDSCSDIYVYQRAEQGSGPVDKEKKYKSGNGDRHNLRYNFRKTFKNIIV